MSTPYEELNVYKKCLELTVYFETTVRGFDKYHKYAIGMDLRKMSQRILMLVAKANIKFLRVECLTQAIELLEELRILVRIGGEIKAFKQYARTKFPTECIISALKQCEGWKNSSVQNLPKPSGERVS